MIPEFDVNGRLPTGIHDVTLEEFKARFVYNSKRETIYKGLLKLISDLKAVGCPAIFVDGSFVTSKIMPADVDVCWDDRGLDYEYVELNLPILFDLHPPRLKQQLLYCADVFPAFIEQAGTKQRFLDFFQQTKDDISIKKGIIKIEIYDQK